MPLYALYRFFSAPEANNAVFPLQRGLQRRAYGVVIIDDHHASPLIFQAGGLLGTQLGDLPVGFSHRAVRGARNIEYDRRSTPRRALNADLPPMSFNDQPAKVKAQTAPTAAGLIDSLDAVVFFKKPIDIFRSNSDAGVIDLERQPAPLRTNIQ